MSLNKAIKYGKEHRKEYRKSKRFDKTCRNHGGCPYCEGNRKHSTKIRKMKGTEEMSNTNRWKPEEGDRYYFIGMFGNVQWRLWGDIVDTLYYEVGNCFRTVEEAKNAAETWKRLLNEHHENKNLNRSSSSELMELFTNALKNIGGLSNNSETAKLPDWYKVDANTIKETLKIAIKHGADLSGVDLHEADLSGVDLHGANLTETNLDHSCWPIWCGSLNVKIDKRQACQLLYHTLRAMQSVDDAEIREILADSKIINLANQFHRVNECEKIKRIEE